MRPQLLLPGFVALFTVAAPAMTVSLTPSVPSPAGVGTMITWTASALDAADGTLWYRFRQRKLNADYTLVRDYGPLTSLDWTAPEHEGVYELEVSARNRDTGETATTSAVYEMRSRMTGGQPVVNPTAHPLVFLYSAVCRGGGRMQVQFQTPGGPVQETPFKNCESGLSTNFYLAGLHPNTQYSARDIVDTGKRFEIGPEVSFTTGEVPFSLFTETILQAPTKRVSDQILLGSALNGAAANDLEGNLLWFTTNGISVITRPEKGGYFWGIVEDGADPSQMIIRKFDLVGMTLQETNAARVNEQLAALGRRSISAFHHEVRTLPDGRIAALADVEQMLTDVQGTGPVDVLGDMIIVFDSSLNVIWTWDTFDHLDVTRRAVLGETCGTISSCAPFFLMPKANDWTHGNSIQQTPDGNLLYSSRHQDWLIKVSYGNGEGDGHVIWRLGKDGDFQFNSPDPYPWFSHQHDANFESSDPSVLLVFDDGNTRVAALGSGNSRGQVLQLDEQARVASFVLDADLGVFSIAVGSAQKLQDKDYHFDAGFVAEPAGPVSYSMEVDREGEVVYDAKANTVLYRSFRMTDMYSPN